ncbi:MAG: hypothetical protein ACYCPN_00675 [Thermoplasmata archaeon]
MIRLRLEALLLGAASRFGRRGPNPELERFARELSDLARGTSPEIEGGPGHAAPRIDR